MNTGPRDVAKVRLDNALALFDEFVRNTVKDPDTATLRGLERRFAERLQIQPSYWSQIKGRSRQIGERLARQFEQLSRKPLGWMDVTHGPASAAGSSAHAANDAAADSPLPQGEDERFIVGLVLTYYRRHPERARSRLLELLGEVLIPAAPSGASSAKSSRTRTSPGQLATLEPAPREDDDPRNLWRRSQAGVAPLKRKR